MSKFKAKLTALLVAVCGCIAAVGIGATAEKPNGIVANAASSYALENEPSTIADATIHNLGALAVHNNSNGVSVNTPRATQLYLKIASGMKIPYEDSTWETEFTLESGDGWKLNGNNINGKVTDIESSDAGLYVDISMANVQVGDVVSVSGTFYSADVNAKYVITESAFTWNGTKWEDYLEYEIHTVGTLQVKTWDAGNNFLYLDSATGVTIPNDVDWVAYTHSAGAGATLNGKNLVIKFPGCVFLEIGKTPVKGDQLVIGGTFYNQTTNQKFVITDTTFWWNGSAWSTEQPSDENVYNIGALSVHENSSGATPNKPISTAVYLKRADGQALPFQNWEELFVLQSGTGLTVNGKSVKMLEMKSTDAGLYVTFNSVAVGDVLSIGGTFYCASQKIKYVISESSFEWNGASWTKCITESEIATYDTISLFDVGVGLNWNLNGEISSKVQQSFAPSAGNTTNSLAFTFNYTATKKATGSLAIRLRGAEWTGFYYRITPEGTIVLEGVSGMKASLALNQEYRIEVGAIDCKDGSGVWTYIKLNDQIVCSATVAWTDSNKAFTTNHISLYAEAGIYAKMSDSYNLAVTYTSSSGTYTDVAKRDEPYTLAAGKGKYAFIGWENNGTLYEGGTEYGFVTKSMSFTAVEVEFTMETGAAIRIGLNTETSGIRFTSKINAAHLNALTGKYGIAKITYGTLILPYDTLEKGEAPNAENFTEGEDALKVKSSTKWNGSDTYIVYRGAMQKVYPGNYGRLFAGRGYMEITFDDGTVWTVYTHFDNEDNVRSIRYVAQALTMDTAEYARLVGDDQTKQDIVSAYAFPEEGIRLMNYSEYANNYLQLTAWYQPDLDPSNGYNNETNIAIVQKMVAAGIQVVYLDGMHHLDLSVRANVEKTRQLIKFFWSQGLQTFAFGANMATFKDTGYPDFSDCEGFIGFLLWDEPTTEKFGTLAELAQEFEKAYAGTDVTCMVNLLPSYASIFQTNSKLDPAKFKAYLQGYCETVLSQVSGQKWLSLDTYPIHSSGSLNKHFLFDLAMLKYYSLQYGATAHAVLQSSGWGGNGDHMPTAQEMKFQAYTAMAFGVDSISWWSYSDKREDGQQNPTDNDTYYGYFAEANNEISALGQVYSAFTWKGVILGAGRNISNNDYQAFSTVKGHIGGYELTASDTKHLASISTNKSNLNYLMGVMQDMNGNEGYVLCNYNNNKSNRAQTITLKFDTNVTEVVIYRGGVAQTVSVTNKTLAVDLATMEGVIILPSKLG